ncbi:MAG: glutamine--tRNA ligase, partial [Opitutaceae bacterium]
LFTVAEPDAEGDFLERVNPESLKTTRAKLEPSLASAAPGDRFQFERLGYFVRDTKDGEEGRLVFNRTLTLRDAWTKS